MGKDAVCAREEGLQVGVERVGHDVVVTIWEATNPSEPSKLVVACSLTDWRWDRLVRAASATAQTATSPEDK